MPVAKSAVIAALGAACFALLATPEARAEVPAASPSSDRQGNLGAELGLGQIDEDYFLRLDLRFGFGLPVPRIGCPEGQSLCTTSLRFGLQVPLRLRVVDNAPEQDSLLRTEDWQELSDYLRVLRFVEYGQPHETLYARLGQLGPVVLGHGTIVNGYYNVITTDHFQLGSHANLHTAYGGVETMVGNLARPTVWGARAYVRPWGFIDRKSFWHRLALGASFVTDMQAPTLLEADETGRVSVGPARRPQVAESQRTAVGGVDMEFNLVQGEKLSVTPYTDLNFHFELSPGLHSGVLVHAWPLESLGLSGRLEYRVLGQNYIPDYFGALYEVDRYQFSGWGETLPAPKLRVARSLGGGGTQGYFAMFGASVLNLVSASASWEDYDGPDNGRLMLRGHLTASERVQLGAFYFKQNFDSLQEAFELDGGMLVTEGRLPITGPLHLHAQYSRLWRLEDSGEYTTVDDWNLGVGASFGF